MIMIMMVTACMLIEIKSWRIKFSFSKSFILKKRHSHSFWKSLFCWQSSSADWPAGTLGQRELHWVSRMGQEWICTDCLKSQSLAENVHAQNTEVQRRRSRPNPNTFLLASELILAKQAPKQGDDAEEHPETMIRLLGLGDTWYPGKKAISGAHNPSLCYQWESIICMFGLGKTTIKHGTLENMKHTKVLPNRSSRVYLYGVFLILKCE